MKMRNIRVIIPVLLLVFFYASIVFAQGKMMKPKDGSVLVVSKLNFNDALGKIEEAISKNNLIIMDDINGQAMIKMAGKKIPPMHQIIFFHPKYMREVYESNPMAGIVVPLKIIIMERNNKTIIRYFKPSTLFKPYKGTKKVAEELDKLMNNIIKTVK